MVHDYYYTVSYTLLFSSRPFVSFFLNYVRIVAGILSIPKGIILGLGDVAQ